MIDITVFENSDLEAIKEIFFLSSSIQSFSSEDRKEAFFKRWCGDYITFYPDTFYVMKDSESKKVLGYLSGCDNSAASLAKLAVPGHDTFKDLFDLYPAHFHINFHPDCRGRGLGSQLVGRYCQLLARKNICGVHLITSPDASNISFYRRSKFVFEDIRVFGKNQLLFMGLNLC